MSLGQGDCPAREDGTHCVHWWEGAPEVCCACAHPGRTCTVCGEAVDLDALPFVGIQWFGDGAGAELRNHHCGGTLARAVFPSPYAEDYEQ